MISFRFVWFIIIIIIIRFGSLLRSCDNWMVLHLVSGLALNDPDDSLAAYSFVLLVCLGAVILSVVVLCAFDCLLTLSVAALWLGLLS